MGRLAVLSLGLLFFALGHPPSDPQAVRTSFRQLSLRAAGLRSQGEFKESYAALEQALALCPDDRRQTYQGRCDIRMALLKWNLGDIGESTRLIGEAAAAFEKIGDPRSQEFCVKWLEFVRLYNLGKDDRLAKLYHRSIDRFGQANALGREMGLPDLQLKCLCQQALAYLDLRDLDRFLGSSQKALEIAMAIHHRTEQGRCWINIGVYHQQRHNYSQAVASFEKALEILRAVDEQETEAGCLSNLGLVYRELGNLERARFYLSEALELDQRRGDTNSVAMDLANMGSVLLRKGLDGDSEQDLRQALEAFQKGLVIQDRGGAPPLIRFTSLNDIGIILNELQDHDGARFRFEQALEIADGEQRVLERCHVLLNIAALDLDERNVEDALALYGICYEVSSKNAFENVFIESCIGLGQCHERRRESDLALSFYRKGIDALEKMRDRISSEPLLIGFARNKLRPFERAVHILADRYDWNPSPELVGEMFVLVERAKARAFLESVREAQVYLSGPEYSILRERQQALSRTISDLSSMLANHAVSGSQEQALRNELEQEEEEFVRLSSEMKVWARGQGRTWDQDIRRADEIQSLLRKEGTVMLEYFLGEPRSYLILVSPTQAKLYPLPAKGTIERSLRAFLKFLSDRSSDPRAGLEAAERIGHELLPLDREGAFKRAKALIVIPDGILHNLPFETLRIRDGAGSRYLVEDMAVSYCPSASALAVLMSSKGQGKWKKGLLAVGATQLPFSKKEVLDIANSLAAFGTDVLTGDAATEGAVKQWPLNDYRIIHFACHGFLDEGSPLRSALVLSDADAAGDDGLLQMREIYGLNLGADLVVLSACQTAAGRLERSEGPMGLARPFFFAGARSVIASLWPVNDQSTVAFMHDFYRSLAAGHPAGEALHDAKKRMLKSPWAHPFYWASFMLQGDPSAAGR